MTDLNDLSAKVERLDERMNTIRAETETAFERLRAGQAEMETRIILALVVVVGAVGTVLGILITSN